MSFDWSEYLKVAKELAGAATTSANQEAKFRAAISRAYYAAFIEARNYLRDQQGHSIPTTGNAHKYVSDQFDISPEPQRQLLAKELAKLRLYRNQADYVDKFPGLAGITLMALNSSEEVILILSNL
ncbi:HEPN domain-containing protein [Nostoc sphaeroides CHAB 2801]|uniref:HEPN domain-containing protein n=1 Tax=Nostoc sphaeroides TaxID=446679 RepID=UPI000E4CC891|nr:HEPN domain-containing protein [Nostoc sphaeroides]MCC5627774.1 HEPN domain-containing protein [Nostoc sphaeroides CHAB 2801]